MDETLQGYTLAVCSQSLWILTGSARSKVIFDGGIDGYAEPGGCTSPAACGRRSACAGGQGKTLRAVLCCAEVLTHASRQVMVEMVALVFARLGDTPLDEAHSPHEDANPLQAAVPSLEGGFRVQGLGFAPGQSVLPKMESCISVMGTWVSEAGNRSCCSHP